MATTPKYPPNSSVDRAIAGPVASTILPDANHANGAEEPKVSKAANPQTENPVGDTETAVGHIQKGGDREQRVREIAYFFWVEEGCPEDQADRHWAAAEALVHAREESASRVPDA